MVARVSNEQAPLPPHKFIQMGCQMSLVNVLHALKSSFAVFPVTLNGVSVCTGLWIDSSQSGSPLDDGMGVGREDWLFRCRQPSRHCEWWYRGRCVPVSVATVYQPICRYPRPPEIPVQSPYTHHQTPTVVQQLAPRYFFFSPPNFRRSLQSGLLHQFGWGYLKATTNKCHGSTRTTV